MMPRVCSNPLIKERTGELKFHGTYPPDFLCPVTWRDPEPPIGAVPRSLRYWITKGHTDNDPNLGRLPQRRISRSYWKTSAKGAASPSAFGRSTTYFRPTDIPKGKGFHSFRRWRTTVIRGARCPEDITRYWLGHSNATSITDRYSRLGLDEGARREWVEKIGLGFSLEKKA